MSDSTTYAEQYIESQRLARRDRHLKALDKAFIEFAGDFQEDLESALEKGVIHPNLKAAWGRYRKQAIDALD